MPHYDTVIVGAGSAGAVLASRLSEDPGRSVCLIEAGPDYAQLDDLPLRVRGFDFVTERPYAGPRLDSHEWQFTARATDRRLDMQVPRGRVIGGSSSINGTVFLRALRYDLDGWAAAGNSEWAYERCLPYFRKLESDCNFEEDGVHGSRGPIPVCRAVREDWLPPSQAFSEACAALGHAYCADMNRPDARGLGPIPVNYRDGLRHSTAIGYLIPSRPRDNLDVLGDTVALGIRFSGRRAEAVSVLRQDGPQEVSGEEIVLCAGAIGSPHLLMLSGIGPADQLRAFGIAPVVDLPEVGQHVLDHPYVMTVWEAREPVTLFPHPGLPWQTQLRCTAPGSDLPDDGWLTMIMTTPRDADGGRGFMIPSSLMYERSRGELRLRSADPSVPPAIDFNFLSDPADLERLRELARLAIQIGSHAAFDGVRVSLVSPSPADLASDAAFDDWIMRTIGTGHHISCTCRMGAVVDQSGRVYGTDNLRVIDASIMPECPGVNLNATVIMMAEKLADTLQG